MNRDILIKWADSYDALERENADLKSELALCRSALAQCRSELAQSQKTINEQGAITAAKETLQVKYNRLRFTGSCTLKQFTVAAHESRYNTTKLPPNWDGLFEAYFAELVGPFALEKTLARVIGAMPK